MITKIVAQLKTGSVKNVIPFGYSDPDESPYVVVKQESDIRGTAFRIIAHFIKGQNIFLDDYIRGEVPGLLANFGAESRHGNFNQLDMDYDENLPQLVIENDDKTISMEALFYMPDMWFP